MLTSAEIDMIAAAVEKRLEPRLEAIEQQVGQVGQIVELIQAFATGDHRAVRRTRTQD